jgi:hypothetical protein
VRGVFDSVASKYDVMNDLMSGGLHRAWKAYTVMVANLREGSQVLDIAGGTGDLSLAFAKKVGTTGPRGAHRHQRSHAARGPRPAHRCRAWCCPPWCAMPSSCRFPTRTSMWSAWPLACAT